MLELYRTVVVEIATRWCVARDGVVGAGALACPLFVAPAACRQFRQASCLPNSVGCRRNVLGTGGSLVRPSFLPALRQANPFRHELIPRPMHGQKIQGPRRIRFQLMSQTHDVVVHRSRRWIPLVSPELLQ